MYKDGKQFLRTIENLRCLFSTEWRDQDEGKYIGILQNTPYPEFEQNAEAALRKNVDLAQDMLKPSVQPYKGAFFRQGLEILRLGKPKGYREEELPRELDRLSVQMARMLLAFEEELDLSVFYTLSEKQEKNLSFRIAAESQSREALLPLVRGTYSQVGVKEFSDSKKAAALSACYYGVLTVPYRDKNQELEHVQDNRCSNWVDAVLATLPNSTEYRVTLKIIPAEEGDLDSLRTQMEELQKAANELMLYAETDWNQSTSVGANYNRKKSMLADGADKIKHLVTLVSPVSGNYGETFAQTRHARNKLAEKLLQQIDQRLYLLNKAIQTQAWRVVLRVEAAEDTTAQNLCSAIAGSLKKDNYVLAWQTQDPCVCAILSSEELLPLVRFPTKEFAGFEFIENEEFALTGPTGDGMEIGHLLWNKNYTNRFFLPEKALNRHTFVCGMTGSGKTNTLFKLLETAAVPFMVIEPVKGEYRALQNHYPDLHIYSMKADTIQNQYVSMLRINPFWFPEHTNIAFHIDSIKTIIASAFEMTNAMPNILEQCMYSIYIKAGWNIVTGKNLYAGTIPDDFLYPTFVDLLDEIDYYLDNSKFGAETLGDYRGAMTSRLKSFVNSYKGLLLNTVDHPDYKQIMHGRSVIELEGLADDADKCLVMGTILVQYFEYLKLHFSVTDAQLQHLMVIEEAHRLFKNGGKVSSIPREGTGADPTGQLVESLSNIMAEIRAFGEGMIIVDQSPSKVAEDVIKNSSTKIIHRVDNENDIRLLQSSLLIPDDQTSLPSLEQGEALIRTDGMIRPCKVKIDRSTDKDEYQLSSSFQNQVGHMDHSLQNAFVAMAILSEDEIADYIRGELWCLLMKFHARGFDGWKDYVDAFVQSIYCILHAKRKYRLIDGRFSLVRHLTTQVVRQLRSHSGISIDIYEIGSIHLFVQRLFDFYEEVCTGMPMREGNLALFSEYYSCNIASLIVEFAETVKKQEGRTKQ